MIVPQLAYHVSDTNPSVREPITLDAFLNNAVVYEKEWTAPIDPRLRRALWLSLIAMIVGLVTTFFAPVLIETTRSSGLILREFLVVWLGAMDILKVPIFFCTWFCIVGAHLFWKRTKGLQSGNRLCQRTATVVALYGAFNTVAVGVPVFVLAINLAAAFVMMVVAIVWAIVQVVFWTIVIITALGILGSGAVRR